VCGGQRTDRDEGEIVYVGRGHAVGDKKSKKSGGRPEEEE
jgi:hypothetical protein